MSKRKPTLDICEDDFEIVFQNGKETYKVDISKVSFPNWVQCTVVLGRDSVTNTVKDYAYIDADSVEICSSPSKA